ncbi:MAG: hydroxymethylglutaryl-CoA lyase [Alphaproteobacteria bacterium]|nr:hydroxymethylglutaryl-CoA lyase [Alphaproteobacteria bacterium]
MSLPSEVKIYEVGPRDGLQNETQNIPTDIKIELIERLADAGLTYIEATSFVSPKAVPQMADHNEVMAGITRKEGVTYAALIPNERGMENALQSGVDEVAIFASASEEFSQKNINCSIEESYVRFAPVMEMANAANIPVRGYVSCVAGCPYEGEVAPEKVAEVAKHLYDMGCYEISLGDTIGIGTPDRIRTMLEAVMATNIPAEKLALHCHDTHSHALTNIEEGLKMGIAVVDSSVAGLGGCPYAPGASGNVATEDVLELLDKLGITTNINKKAVLDTAEFISKHLQRGSS